MGREAPDADVPRLPRAGLVFRDGILIRSFQDTVVSRHDLRQAENFRFETGLHLPSLKIATVPLLLALAAKLLVPYSWLGWTLGGLFLLLALLMARGAWGVSLCFELEGSPVRLTLVGTREEIDRFHESLSAAVAASRGGPTHGGSR